MNYLPSNSSLRVGFSGDQDGDNGYIKSEERSHCHSLSCTRCLRRNYVLLMEVMSRVGWHGTMRTREAEVKDKKEELFV